MAVIQSEYYSLAMNGFISFTAVLPIDLPPAGALPPRYAGGPWPTLYLLHGYSGSRNDWLKNSPIEQLAAQYGLAVIMPDGGNRFWIDNPQTGIHAGEMLGRELIEVTRGMFQLSDKREDTLIGGLSMGGYGALRNGLKYHDTFSAILALSSAVITTAYANGEFDKNPEMGLPSSYYSHVFGPKEEMAGSDREPAALAEKCLAANPPALFLACGSEDFLFSRNQEMHDALDAMGYPHEWWVEPGVHDFDFWNRAIKAALAWWDRRRKGEPEA
jgi:Predicted esterase